MRRFRATFYCVPSLGQIGPREEHIDFEANSAAEAKRNAKAYMTPKMTHEGARVRLVELIEWTAATGDYNNAKCVA